jgi:hypothetical protein
MAANIIWKIVAPKPGWAQLALWKKYFRGPRSRCLENVIQMPNLAFLKLYAKAAPLITAHSYWIPGNGKKINIWTDKIMNKDPIEDRASIRLLRCWMDREGLRSLWDISCWNNSEWAGWKPIEVPDHLTTEWTTLLDLAPTYMRKKDWKGCGPNARGYAISLGYTKLNERPYAPPTQLLGKGSGEFPHGPK